MKTPKKLSLNPETKERIKHGFYIANNRHLSLEDIKRMKLAEAQTYVKLARRAESLAQPIDGIGGRPFGTKLKIFLSILVVLIVGVIVGVAAVKIIESQNDKPPAVLPKM